MREHPELDALVVAIGGGGLVSGISIAAKALKPSIDVVGVEMVLVDEGDIEDSIVMLLEIEMPVVEGAGAAPLAAVMRNRERFRGRKVGLVLGGGNIDPLMLSEIIERGMVRGGRLARITVEIRDVPGVLAKVSSIVAEHGANIAEVYHQRAFTTLAVQNAELNLVLKTRNREHVKQIVAALQKEGFTARAVE
jgi:threonine dehydratase